MPEIAHTSRKDIKKVFVGRSIIAVDEDEGTITLDDGNIVKIIPNSGCWDAPQGTSPSPHSMKLRTSSQESP